MNTCWEFKRSFFTITNRSTAWAYWSDVRNQAEMEGVTIELDGPFHTGTKGRTITASARQEWQLSEVISERRFVITGRDADFELSFAWDFLDEGSGTRMTQTISANGSESEMKKWEATLRQMETNAPSGMKRLADRLDDLNSDEQDGC